MKDLQGSNAIITGASRGLGTHIAYALAVEGVNLALTARTVDALEMVREKVMGFGVKVVAIQTDLTDISQLQPLIKETEKSLGPVDILINNAGVEFTAPFEDFPDEDIENSMKINLLAPMLLTRAVLPGMLKRGRGHILNMSSLAGKAGLPYQTPYSATKSGLVMFTHSLRAELIGRPVGVSVICPGFIAGAGMYARIEETGNHAPGILKPTTIEKVVNAVIKAIKQNIAEIIVNPIPMRPGIILREIIPGITPSLHKLLGTTEFVRLISEKRSGK